MNDSVWILTPPGPKAEHLSSALGIPVSLAQVLANRNIEDADSARQFLFGSLDDLSDPFRMTGMREAVSRIKRAIKEGEKVLVFGDYDVDGVLSVVMLFKALESMGARVDYFIPERLKEGYGIKEEHIGIAEERRAGLVISVDCGIRATDFARKARDRGIDFIVTDHHLPGEELPDAWATINPVLENSSYPAKNLAGVGVVFKLIHALLANEGKASLLPHYAKLAAIGTISDVADLRGENRILVRLGLKGLENVSNIGLRSLIENCGLKKRRVSEGDVGFRIGPRINAAGRMGLADEAVQLFFSKTLDESMAIVRRLEEMNAKRQRTEERILKQALRKIQERSLDKRYKLLILGCEEWHRGVIGIVASRLKDKFHRPVILFAYEDGRAYGSGRSIREFPLSDNLEKCQEFCIDYGGHTLAVGCVLVRENMEPMRNRMNKLAESGLNEEDLKRKIRIDAKLDLADISAPFIEKYLLLIPFGIGNPKPVFLTEQAEVLSAPQTLQGRHIKFFIKQGGRTLEALGWEKGEWGQEIRRGDVLDLAFTLQFSEYLGEERISLSVEDVRK